MVALLLALRVQWKNKQQQLNLNLKMKTYLGTLIAAEEGSHTNSFQQWKSYGAHLEITLERPCGIAMYGKRQSPFCLDCGTGLASVTAEMHVEIEQPIFYSGATWKKMSISIRSIARKQDGHGRKRATHHTTHFILLNFLVQGPFLSFFRVVFFFALPRTL